MESGNFGTRESYKNVHFQEGTTESKKGSGLLSTQIVLKRKIEVSMITRPGHLVMPDPPLLVGVGKEGRTDRQTDQQSLM